MSARERADAVYAALLERQGEQWVQPRVERTRRVLDLLGDPQHAYRVVHLTGTNGKTSTARMTESLLRAMGLRTGLFTSPHLVRFTERILVDGEPIADATVARIWDEIEAIVHLVDAELDAAGDAPLTFFELLTVVAFAAFADAPVDVAVIEVGMGGSWDSTNTADGDVAVFAPIALDHTDRLGNTIEAIATVKAGIIKEGARVVSAAQAPEVERVLRAHAAKHGARIAFEGQDFSLAASQLAVGGQLIAVRGIAGEYAELFVPIYGEHQARNAALAIAAVESLVGDGAQPIAAEVLAEGLGGASSPGRLQLIGIHPSVVVDAAHNPHGAAALATALPAAFEIAEWALVLGVLADKDAAGVVAALAPIATRVFVTEPDSERALAAETLASIAEAAGLTVSAHPELESAAREARSWALDAPGGVRRGVVIAGSVVLAGEALALAAEDGWLRSEGEQ